jgi:acetyltransferase-like isoleucine patch superfamily enzyme
MTGEGRSRTGGGPIASLRRAYLAIPRRLGYVWGPRAMSAIRKRWVLIRHPHADIRFGKHVYLGPGFSLHMPDGGTFIASEGVEFRRDFRAEVGPEGRLVIGPGSVFTYSVLIQCSTSIEIGARCMFGQSTIVVDGNHRFRDLSKPMLKQGYDYRPIRIADDVTVTTKCTIIADIGERAFIGANSVVTKAIPSFMVAVGSPATAIEYFGPSRSGKDGEVEDAHLRTEKLEDEAPDAQA